MLNINAKESQNLIRQIAAIKVASVQDRFQKMAQLSVATEAANTNEKLAAEQLDAVRGTTLPGALAVALMMAKASSQEEGPVIAANAQRIAGL